MVHLQSTSRNAFPFLKIDAVLIFKFEFSMAVTYSIKTDDAHDLPSSYLLNFGFAFTSTCSIVYCMCSGN